jgi:hypothetical protein
MQTCHELPAAISATSSVEAPRPQYGGDFSAHIGVHFLKKERRLRNVMWRRRADRIHCANLRQQMKRNLA